MNQEQNPTEILQNEGTNDTSAIEEVSTEAEELAEEAITDAENNGGNENAETAAECDYARLAEEDLATLNSQFPTLFPEGLASMKNPQRYGELREVGLSPVEAFCASHPEILLDTVKRRNNRAHLGTCVPRGASLATGQLSARELEEARELFPSISDGEIEALYRRVAKRNKH